MTEIEIAQVDREAAADILASLSPNAQEEWAIATMRMGGADDASLVQAFARHRIAARKEALEEAAKEVERVAGLNAKARTDRADDELAFEFKGLGDVLATAIRTLSDDQRKGEG